MVAGTRIAHTAAVVQEVEARSAVRLAEIVGAVSLAADLGLGQPMEHVLRSTVAAVRFGEQVGLTREELDATYWVTLLATAGCTGVSYELTQVWGDDIAFRQGFARLGPSTWGQLRYFLGRAGRESGPLHRLQLRADLLRTGMRALEETLVAHCQVSRGLSERVGLGAEVSTALGQTFAQWDGKGVPRGLGGEGIALPMRVCQVAETMETAAQARGAAGSFELVRETSGSWFEPRLAEAWCDVGGEVLASLEEASPWDAAMAAAPGGAVTLTEAALDAALEAVADYADLKSPWFSGHSRGVADLAATAARHLGLAEADVTNLRRAALLHDLGRNGVPNTVWDKPGPLTDSERERVHLHAYYTDRVVRRAGALAPLATIASAAHERTGGSGYPRGIAGDTIPVLGRLLEAADAYHAMREARPHRPALGAGEAARQLREMARSGELRGDAVDAVLAAAGHARRRKASTPGGLTGREIEVLCEVARGLTLKQVGERLGISAKTAGNHLEHIYGKIGAASRAEATMFAMHHGLLDSL